MHKPESVLENEMHRIIWDFGIPTTGQKKRPITKNENLPKSGLCFPGGPQSEKSKKTIRKTSTWTLTENQKSYGT